MDSMGTGVLGNLEEGDNDKVEEEVKGECGWGFGGNDEGLGFDLCLDLLGLG